MKININYIFIFEFIKLTYSITPVWNLKKTGINIFEKYESTEVNIPTIENIIHDNFHFGLNIKLTKLGNHIIKKNSVLFDFGTI